MNDRLERMRQIIQQDVCNRGLATDAVRNLFNLCADDFRDACQSLASATNPSVAIVTGFYIPTAEPPAGETDGPLGALFLARALVPLGFQVALATDDFCASALVEALGLAGLSGKVPLLVLPSREKASKMSPGDYFRHFRKHLGWETLTHLIAIERVGPSHTLESITSQLLGTGVGETFLDFLHAVMPDHQDRYHTMRGVDINDMMSPAHYLFEAIPKKAAITTIGIGDGGNEIGMGKIPWEVVNRNVPGGGLVACRVPTRYAIVAGISNWGAYALAAGVRLLRGNVDPALFDVVTECKLLETMVKHGPLVDGMTGQPTITVDGLPFDRYSLVLKQLGEVH